MDKKERVRSIALSYYSRKDVLDAIFNFSTNREVSPKYFEGFGKRPDSFQYPSDILSLAKKGATSFHCSVERWTDPLQISTNLSQEEINNLREGWDLIIDIDCKWIDYSKKAAQSIVRALEHHGVKNIGIKFSGSKGFHIIVPWEAFPEEINDIQTKNMFPEWPRAVIEYLKEISRPILESLIIDMKSDLVKIGGFTGILCENCKNIAEERFLVTLRCSKHSSPHIESFKTNTEKYKEKKCPNCKSVMFETDKQKFYYCSNCELDSLNNKDNFNTEVLATDIFKLLGLDLLLVSPRHLFRMPYSLHEKTSLASIVLTKEDLENFQIKDADPLNITIKEFKPKPKKNEAKELLIQALDRQKSSQKDKSIFQEKNSNTNYNSDFQEKKFKELNLSPNDLKEDNFPPSINKILSGMNDGRKRALFILINFYRSLGVSLEDLEKKINEWNSKNNPPLKQGYINSQLIWHSRNKAILPPNFDNPIYKELGIYEMDDLSLKVKNPVTYVSRKIFSSRKPQKQNTNKKPRKKNKNKF